MSSVKFPRRYRQRLPFRDRKARTAPKASFSYNAPQTRKPRAQTKGKLAGTHKNNYSDSGPSSNLESDCPSDSDCGNDEDSGYSSGSGYDEVTESYEKMRARFAAQGPVMPELSDGSKDMLKAEVSRWNA